MAPRPRKHNPSIPPHIDQAKIPKGVYWDATGRGRWYIFEAATGIDGPRKARRTVAGPEAKLSELHSIIEMGESTGTVEWVCAQYHDSAKFKGLAAGTRDDYEAARNVLINYPTILGVPFGKLQVAKLRNHNFQRLVDKIESAGTPTKANKVLRYSRLVFRWALNRGIVDHNPAQGLEQAKERKRQRLPTDAAYAKLLAFAHERSMRTARTEGSVPPYLWMIMELGYLCRLRGIETLTLTEAQGTTEGLHTNRRKRSRDNLVEWTPRLRRAWDAAIARREAIIERHSLPVQMRADQRHLFLAEHGEPLQKTSLDSTWQRFIQLAIATGVIGAEERFSLHDLKRKGGTDTAGNRAERQDALGVTDAMMKVYDKSVPRVKPSTIKDI
ncbi:MULTISPECIES: integrase [Stenotrophomonas]|uniref:site-specific integrase n=1 Tax=Stenotrophomonas TaxID=40323 RepID=UPI001C60E620|nr:MULTISPECIES: integrase [Stenotrophomonas]MDH0274866.1 integrase [Stenotrophomonas sp. GD04089]MDH1913349.1 integrase [Stenotrophomonas sp. GD03794]